MSEHKIAQDNIDIDVDVSSTVANDQERDSAPDDTTGDVAATADRVEDSDSKIVMIKIMKTRTTLLKTMTRKTIV